MRATRYADHVGDSQSRLLAQYQERPNFVGIVSALAQHVQQLEDAIFGIVQAQQLSDAQGAQLDSIGALVGASRNGLNDSQYSTLIKGTIAKNNGDATLETLLTIIRSLFGATSIFIKQADTLRNGAHLTPASISLSVGSPTVPASALSLVETFLSQALGAGVTLNYLGQFTAAGSFAMSGNQPWVKGFGSTSDASAGGGLGSILTTNVAS